MWQTKLYPELRLLDTDAERKRLLRDSRRKMKHKGWYFAALFVGIIVLARSPDFVELIVGGYLSPFPTWPLSILVAGLEGAVFGLAIQRLWYKPLRDQVRRELIARGIPVCLHCGYSLTGLSEPRCPECGESFVRKDRSA